MFLNENSLPISDREDGSHIFKVRRKERKCESLQRRRLPYSRSRVTQEYNFTIKTVERKSYKIRIAGVKLICVGTGIYFE